MSTLSRKQAKALIGRIREDNGGISPEDRAKSPPGVLRALENVRRKLGAATKTLATNLYSKDTRFVYELIQNAEDNTYTRAQAAEDQIYLRFNMYPDRIVVESNEDGFCEEHVKAICSTGQSTKTSANGYIGEKGIGFKSVFKVAKKVLIQSGPFSFSFEHTRGSDDDGLGMVTPLDEKYNELPEGVNTKITLILLDPSSFQQRVQDLLDVPDTLLLFLTKLRNIQVNIYPQDKPVIEIEYNHVIDNKTNIEIIKKNSTIDGASVTSKKLYFHVTRKVANKLPPDVARRNTNQATIVLAFPVDYQDEPLIKQQHVFAFLPLRRAGFTFLIQSDFVTQASREDVFHSPRNDRLLSYVAETFRDAVLKFCKHPFLQYKWMRYLPSDSISDEFWGALQPRIIEELSSTRCLRPWSENSLYFPSQLHRVTSDFIDKNGQPLFEDFVEPVYLSPKYTSADSKSLAPLGTKRMGILLMVKLLRSDLQRAKSKMKAIAPNKDWHRQIAVLLLDLLQKKSMSAAAKILEKLDLIPLQDGTWVAKSKTPIYLPNTKGVSIPTDLGLDLVQSDAASDYARSAFFLLLGVTEAPSNMIISKINQKYVGLSTYDIDLNISHLRYLYWNLPPESSRIDDEIFLMDQNESPVYRAKYQSKYLYHEGEDEEYGIKRLTQKFPLGSRHVPGYFIHFLNTKYLDAIPPSIIHHGKSWKQWLTDFAGVQNYLQLEHPKLSSWCSDEFMYIINHRPEMLTGLLKHNWSFYESQFSFSKVAELKKQHVPSGSSEIMRQLRNTFLPVQRLKAEAERLKIEEFPFLEVPELTDQNENEWKFLKLFGVKSTDGSDELYFYLEALNLIANQSRNQRKPESLEVLVEIYSAIERNCSNLEAFEYVRKYFRNDEMIYVPSNATQNAKWVGSDECVWAAPEWLVSKNRLNGILNYASCHHLFGVILKIRDASWKDYLEDLKILKAGKSTNIERMISIYRRLWREFEHDTNWYTIRELFEELELVFLASENIWYSLSSCIWADEHIQISQKASIKTCYSDPNLEDFFCRVLGVPTPNVEMHVQTLKQLARSKPAPSASELKRSIMLISSMNPNKNDVEDLRHINIFSIMNVNGKRTRTNAMADFAIVDREEYGSAFAGKLRVLNYTIQEVRTCWPFFLALGLESQFLSELVDEITTVKDGAMSAELTRNFQLKGYALFRCMFHYHSPKIREGDISLYKKLLGASIYVSESIYKSISVVQYGETVTVQGSRANFHLEEVNEKLRLYVPRDENAREECYFRQLPRRLNTYFGISNPACEAILNGVIGCRSLISVNGILKDAGIVEVEDVEQPSGQDQYSHSYDDIASEQTTRTNKNNTAPRSGLSTPISTMRTSRTAHSGINYDSEQLYDDSQSFNSHSSPLAGLSFPVSPRESYFVKPLAHNTIPETGYSALLDRLIKSARRMAIPTAETASLGILQDIRAPGAGIFNSVFGARSEERNNKVGAAGELLIFEILSNLDLPEFTIENWKSTMRKEVIVHHKYRNLVPWLGREKSDIIYTDSESDLTNLLIEKGYLQQDVWAGARPTYFLEVKTTTKECNEPFYMSGAQYNRMQRMKLDPQVAGPKVYVILRVYNLEGRVGLRVFVDPESARLNGDLDYKVDSWEVKSVSG